MGILRAMRVYGMEGQLFEMSIKVSVVEPEENTKLCGPAAMNEVISYRNDILSSQNIEMG